MLQISLQYFVAFEKYNYLNLNAHFQSQQVIELRNVLLLLKKTNGHRIRQISCRDGKEPSLFGFGSVRVL